MNQDDDCEEDRGGQITLFTKQDCPYCVRLRSTLEVCAEKVLKANPKGKIKSPNKLHCKR